MTVELSHGRLPCSRCETVITVNLPVYRVTKARLPYCEDCARRLAIGPLPSPPAIASPRKLPPLSLDRFNRFTVAAKVRGNILDWRARQAGER